MLMSDPVLRPAVTPEQRHKLETDGYFIVKHALSPGEVEQKTMAVDDAFERHLRVNPKARKEGMQIGNVVEEGDEFVSLLDQPTTFPLVLDLLGPYIALGLSELTVKATSAQSGDHTGFIHTDGGHALSRIRVTESSRPLQVKTHYSLTDCLEPDMGNFTVVPGSHLRTPYWTPGENTTPAEIEEAVPLLMEAGDCVMWTHSLWHGASPNRSSVTRKTLTYAYIQMFIRPQGNAPSKRLLARCTLRQRRLLGDLGADTNPTWFGPELRYFYAPADYADIMLGE